MVFNSIFFIFCFLPVFMLIYYLVPGKLRNLLLFLGSLIFYAWGEPVYVILMLFSSIFNYYMGTELERLYYDDRKQKINLIFSIIINLAVLVFFKYYGFLLNTIGGIIGIHIPHPELSLPIGLSFYTFRNLSYLFDIYLSKVSAQRNFLTFSVYSTMFPYTSAGPIVRYTDIETQLKQRTINISKFGIGAELFVKGLAKKVLLADNLSVLYSSICGHPQMSVFTSWLGILAYTMQLYFDFSGYSDMAIGLGKMLGFDFNKNFDYPYISTSVSEFWRRWHISLGSWFRDYIYIPLGGNRVSTLKHIRNILVVWALTGLWHGASWNFIVWGLLNGIIMLASQELEPVYAKVDGKLHLKKHTAYKVFEIIRTTAIVCVLQMLDYHRNIADAFRQFISMFTTANYASVFGSGMFNIGLSLPDYILLLAGVIIMYIVSFAGREESVRERLSKKSFALRFTIFLALFLGIAVFGVYGIGYESSQFIYNQF